MGDGLTNHLVANNKLTPMRYLFRANIVYFRSMGDGMTR